MLQIVVILHFLIACIFITVNTAAMKKTLLPLQHMRGLLRRCDAMNVSPSYFETLLPFEINNKILGYCKESFAKTLCEYQDTFHIDGKSLKLKASIENMDLKGKTDAVQSVNLQLRDRGLLKGWRNEMLPVAEKYGDEPILLLERAASVYYGTKAYGVHIVGYERDLDGTIKYLWVGRRSRNKSTYPGMLDHIVAGGLPHGVSLMENVIKECEEEASIPLDIAGKAEFVGVLSYTGLDENDNLKRDALFCYDLEIPRDFTPIPLDGEVEYFEKRSLEWVLDKLIHESDDEYKPNCNLVLIDFFIR